MSEALTKQDLIEALTGFESRMDKKLDGLELRMDEKVGEVLAAINEFATKTEARFESIESRITYLESQMVTKEYLDDKLADLKSDLIVISRKMNKKFEHLIEGLVTENSLSRELADRILSLEPFPTT